MNTVFIGDVHLGKRFPYTTRATQQRFEVLRAEVLERIKSMSIDSQFVLLGDLFDSYSVSDVTLIQGFGLLTRLANHFALSGNHDVSNNTDKPSAITLVRILFGKSLSTAAPLQISATSH